MNRVVHFEIQADDADRAQKFYETVFGWQFEAMGPEFGNYRVITTGDMLPKDIAGVGINGGLMKRSAPLPPDGTAPNAFTCIIGVDNIDAYITKAEAAGAKPQTDKMEVPGVGQLRYYKDTEGNIFGMLQPLPPTMPH